MSLDVDDLVERVENRLSILTNKLLETNKHIQTIQTTASSNKLTLEEQLKQVKDSICRIIDASYENLVNAIEETASKDIQNIKNNEEYINSDIDRGRMLVEVAKNSSEMSSESITDINQWLSDVLKTPTELPIVSLTLSTKINDANLVAVESKSNDLLKVTMTGSVQIIECLERPGAILITWDEQHVSDSESVTTDASTITEYILQYCKEGESVFHSLFEGEEMNYIMKFADTNDVYSFRVCRYHTTGGHSVYGPWSMIKQACTSLPPHSWRSEDCETENGLQLYQISNKGRTATKVFPESSHILRSQVPSYRLGETLTFLIEETGESSTNDGIGFIIHEQERSNKLTQFKNAAIMNTKGLIFVNGSPMVTKLPTIKRNSVAVFQATRHTAGKIRVSISVDDREVTFDWNTITTSDSLYFACGFEHTGWQLSVG